MGLWAQKPNGRRVKTLASASFPAGTHAVIWDGLDDASQPVAPGPYWIVFQAGADVSARLVVKTP